MKGYRVCTVEVEGGEVKERRHQLTGEMSLGDDHEGTAIKAGGYKKERDRDEERERSEHGITKQKGMCGVGWQSG